MGNLMHLILKLKVVNCYGEPYAYTDKPPLDAVNFTAVPL